MVCGDLQLTILALRAGSIVSLNGLEAQLAVNPHKTLSRVHRLTNSSAYFSRLAPYEEIDPMMLFCEDCEQGVFKLKPLVVITAWYRHGFTPATGGAFLYKMLDIIVIYIICDRGVSMVCAGTSANEAT